MLVWSPRILEKEVFHLLCKPQQVESDLTWSPGVEQVIPFLWMLQEALNMWCRKLQIGASVRASYGRSSISTSRRRIETVELKLTITTFWICQIFHRALMAVSVSVGLVHMQNMIIQVLSAMTHWAVWTRLYHQQIFFLEARMSAFRISWRYSTTWSRIPKRSPSTPRERFCKGSNKSIRMPLLMSPFINHDLS